MNDLKKCGKIRIDLYVSQLKVAGVRLLRG